MNVLLPSEINPERILFVGYCWGAAGSTWLARLLNNHEDILCLHAPIFPRFDHFVFEDSTMFISAIFNTESMGRAYPVVDFTHGIPLEWHPKFTQAYGSQLRAFTVTRHPVKRIQSSLSLHLEWKEVRNTEPRWRETYEQVYQELSQAAGKTFPDDFASLAFYKSCKMVNSIIQAYEQSLPLYRFEDLTTQEETVQGLLAHISNGECQLDSRVIQKMQKTVVRKRSERQQAIAEVYDSWRPEYREAYHWLVTKQAFELYRQLGYEFPHAIG